MNLEQLIAQMQEQLASALQLKAEQQKAQQKAVHPDSTNHIWQLVTHTVELPAAKVAFEVLERVCQNCAHTVLQIPAAQFVTHVVENCPAAESAIEHVADTAVTDVAETLQNVGERYTEDVGTPHTDVVSTTQPQAQPHPATDVLSVAPGYPAPTHVNPFAPPSGQLAPPPGATVGEPLRANQ